MCHRRWRTKPIRPMPPSEVGCHGTMSSTFTPATPSTCQADHPCCRVRLSSGNCPRWKIRLRPVRRWSCVDLRVVLARQLPYHQVYRALEIGQQTHRKWRKCTSEVLAFRTPTRTRSTPGSTIRPRVVRTGRPAH
uniref:(northern house mosquito) hypothetical protein n=2 Tax=Culex pipiens TaxID=7175 RepID=A0A8D8A5F2_CULPI